MESPLNVIKTLLSRQVEELKFINDSIINAGKRRAAVFCLQMFFDGGTDITAFLKETHQFAENVMIFEEIILQTVFLKQSLNVLHLIKLVESHCLTCGNLNVKRSAFKSEDEDDDGGPTPPKNQRMNKCT